MQEKIQVQENYSFFQTKILTIDQQRSLMKCPNHNQANSVCISAECSLSGLMCLDPKCQCRRMHLKCHHILIDRVLQSIEKHQKEIPKEVKESYKTVYNKINDMIQKLSKLRSKLQLEEQYFGLRDQQLQFMELINNNNIQQVNGKMISSMEKTFQTEMIFNTNSKEEILKDFQEKGKIFEKLCNEIQSQYSLSKQKAQVQFSTKLFQGSKIIQKEEEIRFLNKWLKQESSNKNAQITSVLLFRASQNNFKAKKFHEKCDKIKNTLVIIKNQFDKIIGGFTQQEWKSENIYNKDINNKAFIFSINLKEKYKCLYPQYSIYMRDDYGPIFGGKCGNDIFISDNCNQQSNTGANMFSTYNNEKNYENNIGSKKLFTGSIQGYKFKIKEYEVYQIKGL